MNKLRVASIQFEHQPGDKESNLAKVRSFSEMAAGQGVQLAVFPECCITGYWFLRHLSADQLRNLAEPLDGPSVQALRGIARETGLMVGAGLVEASADGKLFNCYVTVSPEGDLHSHRKLHAFVSPLIESGDQFTVFETSFGWRMAILICYDCNLGENVRICALEGADLLIAPHQTGGCLSKNPHTMGLVDRTLWDNREASPEAIEAELKGPKGRGWLMRWLPARAHDNGLFLVFSNGVGVDDDEIRTGNATVLDPYGRILAETWKAGDDMIIADLDPELLVQSTGRRWIKTRRPELYAPLARPTGREQNTRDVRFDEKGI